EGNAIKGSLEYDFDGNTGSIDFTGDREPEKKKAEAPKADAGEKGADKKEPEKKGANRTEPKRRVIVMLKSRREILVIYSTASHAPEFAIRSRDGKLVTDGVTLAQLKEKYPVLYEQYRTAYV